METKVYRLAPQWKAMSVQGLVAGIVVSSFTTYAALFAPPADKSQLLPMYCVLLLGCGSTVFSLWMLQVCKTYLEVGDTYITQHAPYKEPLVLAWSDITEVRNNKALQRLELRSSTKNAAIMIEHQVQDFAALRQLIVSKTGKPIA